MKTLVLTDAHAAQIRREAAAAYPDECCGIIYGTDAGDRRVVSALEPVPNVFDAGERYHRFSISGKQLMDAEQRAGDRGELVLGFYHSHPDHPARPSEYDREHAWPFYSYAIVRVAKGEAAELTSWELNDATEQFEPQGVMSASVQE